MNSCNRLNFKSWVLNFKITGRGELIYNCLQKTPLVCGLWHTRVRNGSGEGFLGCRGVLGTPNDAPFATAVTS